MNRSRGQLEPRRVGDVVEAMPSLIAGTPRRFDPFLDHTTSGVAIEIQWDSKQTRRYPLEATPRTRGV